MIQKIKIFLAIVLLFVSMFSIGWFSNSLYHSLNGFNLEKPFYLSFFEENEQHMLDIIAFHGEVLEFD